MALLESHFYSLLNERHSRQVLYHFTGYEPFRMIILSDILKKSKAHGNISLSRNYNLEHFGGARITLDADKLKTKYTIKPYSYASNPRASVHNNTYDKRHPLFNEREEIIESDITNVSKYIIQVDLLNSAIMKKLQALIEPEVSFPVNVVENFKPVK